jgi:hypothetical protein
MSEGRIAGRSVEQTTGGAQSTVTKTLLIKARSVYARKRSQPKEGTHEFDNIFSAELTDDVLQLGGSPGSFASTGQMMCHLVPAVSASPLTKTRVELQNDSIRMVRGATCRNSVAATMLEEFVSQLLRLASPAEDITYHSCSSS